MRTSAPATPAWSHAARTAPAIASSHAAGSCSAQPSCGCDIVNGALAVASTAPLPSVTSALTLCDPTSIPMTCISRLQAWLREMSNV